MAEKFKFPPPPRLTKSEHNSSMTSLSDSSNSDSFLTISNKNRSKKVNKKLPPIGIFWDIENCQVPRLKNATAIVQKLRDVFLQNYREAEFIVVCDVKKEHPQVIQELHDSQVNVVHVSSLSKNAADEKLRQSLRRFGETHKAPSAVLLISGDINFAADLSDLRYRKKIRVILVHNTNAADALILCANEHYLYGTFVEDLPIHAPKKVEEYAVVEVSNLPSIQNVKRIKNRLKTLVNNCGGKVLDVADGKAVIKFANLDFAIRAQKRINGEDVLGSKIHVSSPVLKGYSGHRVRENSLIQLVPDQNNQTDYNSCSDSKSTGAIKKKDVTSIYANIANCSKENAQNSSKKSYSSVVKCRKSSESSESNDRDNSGLSDSSMKQNVTLVISNLDTTISPRDIKRRLMNMLREYAIIIDLKITETDGFLCAIVEVASQQEAQFIISKVHKQWLGQKRLMVSYKQSDNTNMDLFKPLIINILQSAPDKTMHVVKFCNLLESRYQCVVHYADLNNMKDICQITTTETGRKVTLNEDLQSTGPLKLSEEIWPYCTAHCTNGAFGAWECLSTSQIINVDISLDKFKSQLLTLLEIHSGSMPLLSFGICYEQEFGERLPLNPDGVPLEHLVTCVSNVVIKFMKPNKNKIVSIDPSKAAQNEEANCLKGVPPSLLPSILLFCKEVIDLLKTTDKCQMQVSKFVPAYHQHFGRQCRVADYGYTKLIDLLESIPHVVQILSEGTNRVLTLSHAAQKRRFTSDLLKVLKGQPCKQMPLGEFSQAYFKTFNKRFNPMGYGMCYFKDLISELPETLVVIYMAEGQEHMRVPKKKQTEREMNKTKWFAIEVEKILKHMPHCNMPFDKFVPAYHNHFGHQLRVSEFGVTKLIELFEEIPDVVRIFPMPDGERMLSLTVKKMLEILTIRLQIIFKDAGRTHGLFFEDIETLYHKTFDYPIRPIFYESCTLEEVFRKLCLENSDFQILNTVAGGYLMLQIQDFWNEEMLKIKVWSLLLEPPYCKDMITFKSEYFQTYKNFITNCMLKHLRGVITISYGNDMEHISLCPLYILASQICYVLQSNGGRIYYNNLQMQLKRTYEHVINLTSYNIMSAEDIGKFFSFMIIVKGFGENALIVLNPMLLEFNVDVHGSEHNRRASLEDILLRRVKWAPPKPDTPPTPGTSLYWNSPTADQNQNFWIDLPINCKPKAITDPNSLISPGSEFDPWKSTCKPFSPPPKKLPLPSRLIDPEELSQKSETKEASNFDLWKSTFKLFSPPSKKLPLPFRLMDQEELTQKMELAEAQYFLNASNNLMDTSNQSGLTNTQCNIKSSKCAGYDIW